MEGFGIHGVYHSLQAGTLLLAGNIPGTFVHWIHTGDPVSGHPCSDVLLLCLGSARGAASLLPARASATADERVSIMVALHLTKPPGIWTCYCDCVTYSQTSRHLNLLSRSSVSHVICFITQITGNNMFRIFAQRRTPLQLLRPGPGTGNGPFHN